MCGQLAVWLSSICIERFAPHTEYKKAVIALGAGFYWIKPVFLGVVDSCQARC